MPGPSEPGETIVLAHVQQGGGGSDHWRAPTRGAREFRLSERSHAHTPSPRSCSNPADIMGQCSSKARASHAAKPVDVDDILFKSPTRVASPTGSNSSRVNDESPDSEEARRIAKQHQTERAAATLTSLGRGFLARQQVEHMRRPCTTYRVNMKAESFGDCFCGWSRAAHSDEALSGRAANGDAAAGGRAQPKKKLRDEADLAKTFAKKELSTCQRYEVNMNAANVGECVCGSAKADHSAAALAACDDRGKSNKVVDEERLRASFVQREKTTCAKFVVNLHASRFGECECGRERSEHSKAALAASKVKAAALVNGDELRKTFVQKEMATCPAFVVDMQSATFGACQCGRLRSEHSAEALRAASKLGGATVDSDELVRTFSICETVECDEYVIDMLTPGIPFGQCLCGEPKSRHGVAALRPRRRSTKELPVEEKELPVEEKELPVEEKELPVEHEGTPMS